MTAIVIIGGGALGLSLAWNLAKRGVKDVVLLERNQLTSGTSWHAAGIVGPLRASPNMTRLAMRALDVFPALEAETGMATGYRRTGGYWLARAPERMDELRRIAAVGQHFGLDARIIAPDEIPLPQLDLSGHVGALSVAEDASINPVDLCMAYARAARAGGVTILENTRVAAIMKDQGCVCGVRLADGSEICAKTVALCAGAWSRPLAATAGVALPLQAVEHMYVVTEPMAGLPSAFPVIRDLDRGLYIKGDTGRLVIGGFEPDAKCWDAFGPEGDRPFLELPEDWEQFGPFMQTALDLVPALADTGIQRFMNGPESFTVDSRPLVGPSPTVDGLYVAVGMNSVGVMSSAGIGEALAGWITDGTPSFDLWEIDLARADPLAADEAHLQARMTEAVADVFAVHWPYKQPNAGRGLRKSMLHSQWAKAGAVFGVTAGWERGFWYARAAHERNLPYAVGRQPWEPIAAREAKAMAEGAALLDLTPFTKIDVTGPDALPLLQSLASANLDVAEGSAVYTPFLNARGGIEADVTVTPTGNSTFRITSGAATRWHDLGFLRRGAAGHSVEIVDCTEAECVIGVMGPTARTVLQTLSDDDWHRFPFSTSRPVIVAGVPCRATRISFVGELGWELAALNADAHRLFDALRSARASMLGHYALDGCRMEKGYRHWGHEMGSNTTPLEAGIGFTIDWSKNFVGKPALEKQRNEGLTRRIVLFDIPPEPLMLHDEPILSDGRVVGFTTSGAVGPRTGRNLAFALIDIKPGESLGETCARDYELEVAGQRYPAKALRHPPYDPKGERMRA